MQRRVWVAILIVTAKGIHKLRQFAPPCLLSWATRGQAARGGRALRGSAGIKGQRERASGGGPTMRDGLSSACDATRPRLCRFLRRIFGPKVARRVGPARYSAWDLGSSEGVGSPGDPSGTRERGRAESPSLPPCECFCTKECLRRFETGSG